MAETETWTVGRLLQWTAEFLGRHGSESPRLDTEVLLAESLGCQRIHLYTSYDTVPSDEVRTKFRDLVRRRSEGMPVAYLVGRREFYSLTFRVTPDVLIPRPETEFLVIGLLDLAKQRPADQPLAVCDVGTGSGIIAVSVAKYSANARVTAVDLSPPALAIAQANAATHGVAERIAFLQSDLLAVLPAEPLFDFIASNPPYVSASEYEALAPEVKDYEPQGALVAGPKGTEIIQRLIPQAADRLRPGGYLLMEISPMIHDDVQALLAADDRFEPLPTVKDLARLPRVVQARRKQ